MIYRCKLCRGSVWGTLYTHYRVYHPHERMFPCGGTRFEECESSYSDLSSLIRHIRCSHNPKKETEKPPIIVKSITEESDDDSIITFTEDLVDEELDEDDLDFFQSIMRRIKHSVLEDSSKFVTSLSQLPTMPLKHVFTVCNEVTLLYAPFFHWLSSIRHLLPPPQMDQFDKLTNIYSQPFKGIATPHLLYRYLTDRNLYIAPQELVIEKTYRLFKNRMKEKFLTAQFIPLQKLFSNFLSLPNVLPIIKDELAKSNAGLNAGFNVLSSFLDGELWKKNVASLQSKRAGTYIPILHYYDDFETCNPLGSKAGVHKIGGNYTVVLALPPQFNSCLTNLLLSEVFHSSDRVQFSNTAVFKGIISQYDILARNGVQVELNGTQETVYPVLQLCSGDNLSINGYMGFVESFTANYPCRFCKMLRSDFASNFYDDEQYYRNLRNYDTDVALSDVSTTGIKERCPFNDLTRSTGACSML